MNVKYVEVVAALAVMLVAAIIFATPGSEFGYKKSQAVSQVNNCGNGESPGTVWCQNTASQIQGKDDRTVLTGTQDGGASDSSGGNGGTGDGIDGSSNEAPMAPMGGSTFGGSGTGQFCDIQFCYSTSNPPTWRP